MSSRGQCCATDRAERPAEAEENVRLFVMSLTAITPFELSAFAGSQRFLLICATLSGRQLGFGEKAKFCSCQCNLCFF